eukprot:351893-Chlamydomonas_euryale.AAC.8
MKRRHMHRLEGLHRIQWFRRHRRRRARLTAQPIENQWRRAHAERGADGGGEAGAPSFVAAVPPLAGPHQGLQGASQGQSQGQSYTERTLKEGMPV